RTIGTIAALLAALAVNAALAAGELRVRRDAVYTATMQPERDREIARELARWTASQSQPPSAEALAAQQARLERAHPPSFPFAWLLGLATALAVLAGAVRSRPAAAGPIAPRLLGRAAVLAAAGVALVIALDAALT
ncbi:MAG TPA: hypothetical protein VLX92_26400, partial [Kofleriaceae bacterium]|nr:hypothetical protein [Kofleriaceae bacterium]